MKCRWSHALFYLFVSMIVCLSYSADAQPNVSSVTMSSDSVGRYDILTLEFGLSTSAENHYWPYDVDTPAPIAAGTGVTVDGLFSNDNWASTVTVPGFYYQAYERALISGDGSSPSDEAVTPVGSPSWRIRFAPASPGEWRCKIQVQDSSGTTVYPSSGDMSFQCTDSSNHGFVQISPNDARYFQLSDGTPVLGPGVFAQFHSTYEADSLLSNYHDNGISMVRWWMNCREWQNPFGGGSSDNGGGPQWQYTLCMSNTGGRSSGELYAAKLSKGANTRQMVYVQAGLIYRFTGYIKATEVTGETGTGVVPFINNAGGTPVATGTAISGTQDWTEFSLQYVSPVTGIHYVGVKNTGSAGTGYFDDVSLKCSTDGGLTWSAECLSKGNFDYQNYVDLREAWKVDHIFETAKSYGVYLKTVISEKGDYTLGCMGSDGLASDYWVGNYYASDEHPSRWLQKAWWRYLSARWGAYTSRHSWELCNEGDPFDDKHYDAANSLASFVHEVDPNRALCTTSFWHSIPIDFWKTSSCDYIDCHEYIGPYTSGTGSHGPRYYAWYDPTSSARESSLIPITSSSSDVLLDTENFYTGTRSCRVTGHDGAVDFSSNWAFGPAEYHVGIDPAKTYTLRYKVKASNVGNAEDTLSWTRPGIAIYWSAAYHENDYKGEIEGTAPLGTYDWQEVSVTGIVPPANANTANLLIRSTRNPSGLGDGVLWVDDVEFIDESTGQDLFVDGGFENDRIDYDAALAVKKYGVLLNSYGNRISKPAVWAESGIRGLNIYGSPYKDYTYMDENQQLVDDPTGIHIKKMIWAHAGPDNPNMLYWWTQNLEKKNLWHYFGTFQAFMSGIPVSNGHYVDAQAAVSTSSVRAWGQKDLTNNCAHLWIDNTPYTWKNVVDGLSVPAVSGTVTVSGFANGQYRVEWWDTSTGEITGTEDLTCSDSSITLNVQNLQSDAACKIYPMPAKIDLRVLVPSSEVIPGETVTVTVEYTNSGESGATNVSVSTRVPAEMDYVTGSAEETGGTWDSETGYVTWIIDQVDAHQTGTRTFRAIVK